MSRLPDPDWVSFGPAPALPEALATALPDRAALLEWDGGTAHLWRGAYLRELREFGLVAADAPSATLLEAAARHPLVHRFGGALPALTPRPPAGR